MKKVLLLSSAPYGSIGKICKDIMELATDKYECRYYVPSRPHKKKLNHNTFYFGTVFEFLISQGLSLLTGFSGCYSYFATRQLIKTIKKFNPDIIHLHNLHNAYINITLLLKYIKVNNTPTVWTLHDCWSFTGHCPHFMYEKCEKWKSGCFNCPRYKEYPRSLFDNSKTMFKLKKKWFLDIPNLTIVTPSVWLKNMVKESYLKDYNCQVINNGINIQVFKPIESNFRKDYNINDNVKLLLGVSIGWNKRKGLDVFIEMAKQLDSSYQIVLVGTDENIDKQLPSNIISIHRTHNQTELAKIYTAADLFINPTREDTYPTVNMEAIACGTPVITFETGGSSEMLDLSCGLSVPCDDINLLIKEIKKSKPFNITDNTRKSFNSKQLFMQYIDLYNNILDNKQSNL